MARDRRLPRSLRFESGLLGYFDFADLSQGVETKRIMKHTNLWPRGLSLAGKPRGLPNNKFHDEACFAF